MFSTLVFSWYNSSISCHPSTQVWYELNNSRKTGFCMHSDWILGYFINFYNISAPVKNPDHRKRGHARIEAYKDSDIYSRSSGVCRNQGDCPPGSDICHYASASWMEKETERWLRVNE